MGLLGPFEKKKDNRIEISPHELEKLAISVIQDSEFVQPGSEIELSFYDAIELYKKAYIDGVNNRLVSKGE